MSNSLRSGSPHTELTVQNKKICFCLSSYFYFLIETCLLMLYNVNEFKLCTNGTITVLLETVFNKIGNFSAYAFFIAKDRKKSPPKIYTDFKIVKTTF